MLHHLKSNNMNTSRRTFLKQTGAASAIMLLSPKNMFAAPSASSMIGLQLWTVKEDAAKDLDSTLKHIAEVGYNNVELFGYNKRMYFGKTILETKALLDKYKLKSTSAHVAINDFLFNNDDDQLKYAIEDAKTLGHDYLTQPWFAEDKRSMDTFKMLVDRFNKAGEMCKKAGLKFAYHNHNFEFVKTDGTCGYEVLLKGTQKDLVWFEMDLYWVIYSGEKPDEWFRKYPGRFPMWHVKDISNAANRESTIVGRGTIDFKEIFMHKKEAGFKTFFIEQEAFTDMPPEEAIVADYKYVKANLV